MIINTTKGKVDWNKALDILSHGAYFMLATLKYKNFHVTDETIMALTGSGLSTHRKHKKELMQRGFLSVLQTGRGKYHYTIGEI